MVKRFEKEKGVLQRRTAFGAAPRKEEISESKAAVDLLDFAEANSRANSGGKASGDLLDLMSGPDPGPTGSAASAPKAPKASDLLDLGFDEPPKPTDFTKEVETLPLPEQITLDLSKCEKGPIGPGGYM